jgi:transmembrane sensor
MKPPAQTLPSNGAELETLAADWIARRDAGLTLAEAAALRAWVAADPRHAAAFEELQGVWAALNQPRHAGRGEDLLRETAAREAWQAAGRRRRFVLAGAGLAAAAALVLAFVPLRRVFTAPETSTVTLRPDRQVLPDGSVVELAAGAEIAVEFSPARRGVRLVRGEALFEVAKNPARPFVVSAGSVDVRAVGTAFSVRFAPTEVAVLVTEGRVAVERNDSPAVPLPAASPEPTYVSAGNSVVMPANLPVAVAAAPLPQAVSPGQVAQALAWRSRRVEFTSTPLAEAVAMMNRQNAVQLSFADPATAELRITGVFWTDDPEGFSRLLASSLGLKVAPAAGGGLVLGR